MAAQVNGKLNNQLILPRLRINKIYNPIIFVTIHLRVDKFVFFFFAKKKNKYNYLPNMFLSIMVKVLKK